jgi:hypothetical protein
MVSSTGGVAGAGTACTALAAPTGATVTARPADGPTLDAVVSGASGGTTILLEDGTYLIPRLNFTTSNVTLRSVSNNAAAVILDGQYLADEAISITASNVTIAHVSIEHAYNHPIHVSPPSTGGDITGVLIYGVHIEDGGQQFIKINSNGGGFVDNGRVECSTFLMTTAGRAKVDTCCGGCYTGGIDGHAARGWIVRQNRFEGIYCDGSGLAEHAIHFWRSSRDTLVENNTIINCARGIGFGLGDTIAERTYPDSPYGGANLQHYDGIIRNNVIFSNIDFFDTGIELQHAREPRLYHNTVISDGGAAFFSSIDWRFTDTQAILANNLATRLTERDGAMATLTTNLPAAPGAGVGAPLSYFVNPAAGDLHLSASASGAVDQGTPVTEAGVDMDGETHDIGAPDLGADERK